MNYWTILSLNWAMDDEIVQYDFPTITLELGSEIEKAIIWQLINVEGWKLGK